jgi:hypothetical protein
MPDDVYQLADITSSLGGVLEILPTYSAYNLNVSPNKQFDFMDFAILPLLPAT